MVNTSKPVGSDAWTSWLLSGCAFEGGLVLVNSQKPSQFPLFQRLLLAEGVGGGGNIKWIVSRRCVWRER